jgi:hypothetical protein
LRQQAGYQRTVLPTLERFFLFTKHLYLLDLFSLDMTVPGVKLLRRTVSLPDCFDRTPVSRMPPAQRLLTSLLRGGLDTKLFLRGSFACYV